GLVVHVRAERLDMLLGPLLAALGQKPALELLQRRFEVLVEEPLRRRRIVRIGRLGGIVPFLGLLLDEAGERDRAVADLLVVDELDRSVAGLLDRRGEPPPG